MQARVGGLEVTKTHYKRPLPDTAIAFASREGRQIFAEAMEGGGLEGYFPLAEQFHTQSEPAYCGLGSLVMALNALAIDPERQWKGVWRWFADDMLDCCLPLAIVREQGLNIDQLACLARCNRAEVTLARAEATNLAAWRTALGAAAGGDSVVIASYDRAALGQTGRGHFSPIGGYHRARDLALVLDVARFKYPPHWIPAGRLWQAMQTSDAATGRSRGWMTLRKDLRANTPGFMADCGLAAVA
jgi:glutathione gamma-glutamylcysteinyltransferase